MSHSFEFMTNDYGCEKWVFSAKDRKLNNPSLFYANNVFPGHLSFISLLIFISSISYISWRFIHSTIPIVPHYLKEKTSKDSSSINLASIIFHAPYSTY